MDIEQTTAGWMCKTCGAYGQGEHLGHYCSVNVLKNIGYPVDMPDFTIQDGTIVFSDIKPGIAERVARALERIAAALEKLAK